jgi:D-alanine-D-alanine ligase
MRIVVLHSEDATEDPADPVLSQVAEALRRSGHEVQLLSASTNVPGLTTALDRCAPELVFNLAESFAGKSALESSVASLLNLLDLRYTGSNPTGLLLAGDKTLAKKVLRYHGIQTPEFATIFRGAVDAAERLRFPVIVKPQQEDGSIGITTRSVVNDLKALFDRMDALQSEHQQPVLVEQFIDGREFYVGVLGNAHATTLPIVELDYSGFPEGRPRVASWAAKWGDEGGAARAEFSGTQSVIATAIDDELKERMQRAAIDTFAALRLRDYARVDMRVTASGEIYVLEANPNCYLEESAEFARAARASGVEYDALIARIVELAGARYAH